MSKKKLFSQRANRAKKAYMLLIYNTGKRIERDCRNNAWFGDHSVDTNRFNGYIEKFMNDVSSFPVSRHVYITPKLLIGIMQHMDKVDEALIPSVDELKQMFKANTYSAAVQESLRRHNAALYSPDLWPAIDKSDVRPTC